MASVYPGGLDTLNTGHVDSVGEIIHAADIDNIADAVNKIEAELGILPKGTFSSVAAKLTALYYGTVTTTGRNAITAGNRPPGLTVFNSTTNRYEYNAGSDATPNWLPVGPSGPWGTTDLVDGSVTTAKLVTNAVTANELADNAVDTAAIAATAVTLAKLASNSVDSTKIIDGSITSSKFAPITINAQTASYQVVLSDAFKIVEISNGSAVALTIPSNATVAFPVGSVISVVQTGIGQVTLTAAGGVSLRSNPGPKIISQWGVAQVYKRATDEWVAYGNLTA